jgi:hypothetical protein
METSQAWAAIDEQRRVLVRLLDSLSADEWNRASLCDGWTVRQVAAHLALQNTAWSPLPRVMIDTVRHGGMNGAIHAMACRHGELAIEVMIAEIRDRIAVHQPLPGVVNFPDVLRTQEAKRLPTHRGQCFLVGWAGPRGPRADRRAAPVTDRPSSRAATAIRSRHRKPAPVPGPVSRLGVIQCNQRHMPTKPQPG